MLGSHRIEGPEREMNLLKTKHRLELTEMVVVMLGSVCTHTSMLVKGDDTQATYFPRNVRGIVHLAISSSESC
jgi:hypothetical protein